MGVINQFSRLSFFQSKHFLQENIAFIFCKMITIQKTTLEVEMPRTDI